jgi:hypothetical protein
MYPRRMVRQALRLGLLVALVFLTLSACGGDNQQVSEPKPLAEEQELRPGHYRSEEFKPSLSFEVTKGWKYDPPEAFDILLLTRGEAVGLAFLNVQHVYEPSKSGLPIVVNAPENLLGWFQEHPYLQTSNPEPVTVGGVKDAQFDVAVA